MTVTTTPAQPAVTEDDSALTAPLTYDDVVEAIARDAGCCTRTAGHALHWIAPIIAKVLETGDEYHPTTEELADPLYEIIDAVMPHDVTIPAPGSAHDLLGQLLASTPDRVGTIVHTMTGENGEHEYCAFLISVHSGGLGTNG